MIRFSSDKIGMILFNISLIVLMILILVRFKNESTFESRNETENVIEVTVDKVCVSGIWDECFDYPNDTSFEILILKPQLGTEEKILMLRRTDAHDNL